MVSSRSSSSAGSDDSYLGESVRYTDRPVPRISMRHFHARIDCITAEIAAAAERHGVFALVHHGIPQAVIEAQFSAAKSFFALPDEVKAKTPFDADSRAGWEPKPPPSAVTEASSLEDKDREQESYRMRLGGEQWWVADTDLPGFRPQCLSFMQACHILSTRLMVCLARGLGLTDGKAKDDHVFVKAHDPALSPLLQSGLRLQKDCFAASNSASPPRPSTPPSPSARSTRSLRSSRSKTPSPSPVSAELDPSSRPSSSSSSIYRWGAVQQPYSDDAFLTLRFLRPGQSGLEICQGRKLVTDCTADAGSEWTKIEAGAGEIICSVGDLLMLWSDDRYKSALCRNRTPADPAVDHQGSSYSLAYINQPSRDCMVQGPLQTYPAITAGAFADMAQAHSLAELAQRKQQKAFAETIAATSAMQPPMARHAHYHDDASLPTTTFGMSSYIGTTF
ncbi:hypothetical protein SEPCBS119000_005163 [Sporothrix epigloea]|uniref:Non-haem dioxygenase N-terminal domain-containing protein n=1 Tax=Sporothrix epigloea TaxID=1892477 RepID=A0ABP0DW29_9PEZI